MRLQPLPSNHSQVQKLVGFFVVVVFSTSSVLWAFQQHASRVAPDLKSSIRGPVQALKTVPTFCSAVWSLIGSAGSLPHYTFRLISPAESTVGEQQSSYTQLLKKQNKTLQAINKHVKQTQNKSCDICSLWVFYWLGATSVQGCVKMANDRWQLKRHERRAMRSINATEAPGCAPLTTS